MCSEYSTHDGQENSWRFDGGWGWGFKERISLGNLDLDGRKLLKWVIESWDWRGWIGWIRLVMGTTGGLL
jgi:hypothetical protein